MPNQKTAKLSNSLIIAGITHVCIGIGYLRLSKLALHSLTSNAYMGIFPGLVFFFPFVLIIADLARMFPHQSIVSICRQVFGRHLGFFFSLTFFVPLILITPMGFKEFQLMIASYFFTRTPQFLLGLFLTGMILYLAWHGITAITRLAAFMLIPPLITIFVLHLLGLSNVNWLNVQPILAGAPGQWLGGGIDFLFIFTPITFCVFYLPHLENPKQVLKINLIILSILLPLFISAILGIIGTFGPMEIPKLNWPAVEFFHVLDMPYLLLEQAGLFFLIAFIPFHFLYLAQSLYLTSEQLTFLCPRMNLKWIIIINSAFFLIASSYPINTVILFDYLKRFYWIFATIIYSPFLITWLIARIRLMNKSKLK